MREMNMSEGSLLKKIILYALPLIATNILQLLFNAADVAVLGAFVGDDAVAAVGATGAIINLIIGLFVGLSVGANVIVARCVGAQDKERAQKIVGMSVLVSVTAGLFLMVVGVVGARTFLELMNCDPDVIDMSTKYIRIYFLGMPIMMLYNFAASILRAVGDTLRPLIYLVLGGFLNVGLNLFFVLVLNKTVEGVAIATIAAQTLSAILALIALSNSSGYSRLCKKYIKIYPRELWEMVKIGLPAGLQSCLFSISNVLIQSSINSFGKVTMAANTVAAQFDGFVFNAMNGVSLSALAFVSQNLGAKKPERIRKTVGLSALIVTFVGIFVCSIIVIFAEPLCSIITKSPEVIEIAKKRLTILGFTYFTCGVMDVFANAMRGLGRSTLAMIITLSGTCLFRILWLKTVFVWVPTLDIVYFAYPVSWAITIVIYLCVYFPTMRKTEKLCKAV